MKILGDKWLMMIEPVGPRSPEPIDDEITQRGRDVLASARDGRYRGFHTCTGCPPLKDAVRLDRETTSGSCDLLVRGPDGGDIVTNSLLVHYLRFHRAEVPEGEIEKLMRVEEALAASASVLHDELTPRKKLEKAHNLLFNIHDDSFFSQFERLVLQNVVDELEDVLGSSSRVRKEAK